MRAKFDGCRKTTASRLAVLLGIVGEQAVIKIGKAIASIGFGLFVPGGILLSSFLTCAALLLLFPTRANAAEQVIYSFTGCGDGGIPTGNLVLGTDGNFYGVTNSGGASTTCTGHSNNSSLFPGGYGTVFKLTPAGTLTMIYSFTGNADGGYPPGPLILGSGGKFYGVSAKRLNL